MLNENSKVEVGVKTRIKRLQSKYVSKASSQSFLAREII